MGVDVSYDLRTHDHDSHLASKINLLLVAQRPFEGPNNSRTWCISALTVWAPVEWMTSRQNPFIFHRRFTCSNWHGTQRLLAFSEASRGCTGCWPDGRGLPSGWLTLTAFQHTHTPTQPNGPAQPTRRSWPKRRFQPADPRPDAQEEPEGRSRPARSVPPSSQMHLNLDKRNLPKCSPRIARADPSLDVLDR